jgi:hypothetical protein
VVRNKHDFDFIELMEIIQNTAEESVDVNIALVRRRLLGTCKLGINPCSSPLKPILKMVYLPLETAKTRRDASPFVKVPDLRFLQLIGHRVYQGVDIFGAKGPLPQFKPPIGIFLPEIRVLKKPIPPDVIQIIGPIPGSMPTLGIIVATIGRIE